jgi:acyl-CoA synthetase (NDP forming)
VRLIGPNSMGVISTRTGMALTVNTVMDGVELLPGPFALVSQSGSLIGTLLSRAQARGLGFSHLVAVGNEADLTVGEILEVLVDDPDTQAILLFLETLRGADGLAAAARRAFTMGKPVIAYKLGQSDVGRSLAASHTGALVGPSENVSAFSPTTVSSKYAISRACSNAAPW